MLLRLQSDPISVDALLAAVRDPAHGALALFLGVVRDHNRGRRVDHLEYHAYEQMAEDELRRLAEEATAKFGIGALGIVHRTGRLEIGDASVAVAVGAAHRADAIDACRFLIDELKRRAPIWKKEVFDGGEVWIEGEGESPVSGQP